MTIMIDLRPEVEARLAQQARTAQQPMSEYLNGLIESLLMPKEVDLDAFLALPREEQDRLMAAAAEDAAPLYAADLELPPAERELTAFTALDGEPFHDDPD